MPFAYERAGADLSSLREPGTHALAGGTDLLPLHKVGLVDPRRVLDVKTSDLASTIERTDRGWRIGALATLADVEDHAELRADLPVLALAVDQAATRQLRNRATVGGNLLQRPRCRYYRGRDVTCWFAGGEGCPARSGRNEHHALFDTGLCVAVQPSDLASALVCVGAEVTVRGEVERAVPVAELFAAPTDQRRSLHHLPAGEAVVAIDVPAGQGARSTYRKAMDRAAWQFALAGVAAMVRVAGDGTVAEASLVASGVAAVPWRLEAAEAALRGHPFDDDAIAAAVTEAPAGASPLAENGYKAPLLRGLVDEALDELR